MTLLDRPLILHRSSTSNRRAATIGEVDLWALGLHELNELAIELNGRAVPGLRMTERQFVEWCPSGIRAEWADGEVLLSPPANAEHDRLDVWFIALLALLIERDDLGVIHRDVWVRLAPQRRRRIPDLMFIAKRRRHIIKQTVIEGPPDLVIEIVSPDSQSRDRRTKFLEYEAAGVREYWIVDPLSQMVEVYALRRRRYRRLPEDEAGFINSTVLPNFRLKPDILWQTPWPKVSAVLRQMNAR